MSPLLLVGLLVISPTLGDVKHVLEGSAHPPEPNSISPQAVNYLASNSPDGDYWWMNSNSPLKAAYDYYKKCTAKSNCLPPINPAAAAPQPFLPNPHPAEVVNIDVKKNPFLSGNFQKGNAHFNNGGGGQIDLSKNPFLNGGVITSGNGAPVEGGNGFIGVQPAQPFKKPGFATKHPLEKEGKPGFASKHPLEKQGQEEVKECKGIAFVCVEKHLCHNGFVNKNGEGVLQLRSDLQYCDQDEVCCQLNNLNEITAGKSSVPIKLASSPGFSSVVIQPEIFSAGEHGHHSGSNTPKSPRDTSFSTPDYSNNDFGDVRFGSTFQGPAYLPPVAPTKPPPRPFQTVPVAVQTPSINQQYRPTTPRPAPPSTTREYLPPSPTTPRPRPPSTSREYLPPSPTTPRPAPPSTSREYLPPRPSTPRPTQYVPPQTTPRPYQPLRTTQRPYQPPQTTQRPYQPPQTTPRPYQPPQTTQRPYQPPQTTPRPYQPSYQPSTLRPSTSGREYLPPRPQPSTPRPVSPFVPQQTTPRPQPPTPPRLRPTPSPFQPEYTSPIQPRPTPAPYQPRPTPAPSRPTPGYQYPSPSPTPYQPRPTPAPYQPRPTPPQPRPTPGYQYPSPSPTFQPRPTPAPQPRPTPAPYQPRPTPAPQPRPTPAPYQPRPTPAPYQPRPTPQPQPSTGYQYPSPSPSFPTPQVTYIPSTPSRPPYQPPQTTQRPYQPPQTTPRPYRPPQTTPRPYTPPQTPATGGYVYPQPTPTFGYPTTPRQDYSGSNINNQFVQRPKPLEPINPDQSGEGSANTGLVLRPSTQRPQYEGEQNNAPPSACAAALKCVQEIYCSAEGVISPVPVVLTKQQEENRVPTTVCQDTESGIIGKCCRDPNYKDPWPSANLVDGFDDGQYKEDDSIGQYRQDNSVSQYRPDLQRNIRSHTRNSLSSPPPKCGERHSNTSPRGPGPLDANFAEIPWQAMILRDSNRSLLCGGVIVKRNAVLTAAHCVEGLETSDILIKGGEWKLGIDEEPLPFQIVKVAAVVKHPLYQSGALVNDLALLVLEEKLRPSKNIGTLCLPPANQIPTENCIATGWGKRILQLHAKGAIMHSIDVKVMDNAQCQETLAARFQNSLPNYSPNTLCGYSNIDQCRVDYGSALACLKGDQYVLSGIYAWDTGCKQEGQIGGYVAPDVDWIESTLARPLGELKKLERH